MIIGTALDQRKCQREAASLAGTPIARW